MQVTKLRLLLAVRRYVYFVPPPYYSLNASKLAFCRLHVGGGTSGGYLRKLPF